MHPILGTRDLERPLTLYLQLADPQGPAPFADR